MERHDIHIEEVLKTYFKTRIETIWKSSAVEGRKLPYAVEEPAFNSFLLASIYDFVKDQGLYSSFAISEGEVKRNGRKGYCDIVWYTEQAIYYLELKGSSFGAPNAETDLSNAVKSVEYARQQILAIDPAQNEEWYRRKGPPRVGVALSLIQSTGKEGQASSIETNFKVLDALCSTHLKGDIQCLARQSFLAQRLPIITDGSREYVNDGYFVIGTVFPLVRAE